MSELLAAAPSTGDIAFGDPSAPVTVIEYTSLLCPYFGTFRRDVWPTLKAKYIATGKVRWIVREYSLGNADFVAFALGRCAGADAAGQMIEDLFGRQREVFSSDRSSETFIALAASIGFDKARIAECLGAKTFTNEVDASRRTAEDSFHVQGTPTFFLPGRRIVGLAPAAEFFAALDVDLARLAKP